MSIKRSAVKPENKFLFEIHANGGVKIQVCSALAIILSLMIFNGKLGFMSDGTGMCKVRRCQVLGIRFQEGDGESEAGYGLEIPRHSV